MIAIASSQPVVSLTLADRGVWNQRWRVQLRDGAQVECVLYRGDTLCISTQVGCAVRCPFCASGASGLARALTLEEMIGQIEAVRALGHPLVRITASGVGEPLHNHQAVSELLAHCRRERLDLSLTSSGGPLARLREWLHAPHNGLTLSIHAGSEASRARLVPNAPALQPLFALLGEELPRMTRRRRKKTALAYLLVAGENDADDEVDAFLARAEPLALRVHLYTYNPLPDGSHMRSDPQRHAEIYRRMTAAGLRVTSSSQARIEANGGCGTLVALRPRRDPAPFAQP